MLTVMSKVCSACPAWLCCAGHDGEKWAWKCRECGDIILFRCTEHNAKTGATVVKRIWGVPEECPLYQEEHRTTSCWLCKNADPTDCEEILSHVRDGA